MSGHVSIPMDTLKPGGSTEKPKVLGLHNTQEQNDNNGQENCMGGKTPTPIYRHAAPSGPWPWMDFDEDIPIVSAPEVSTGPDERSWHKYPQNLFPNWTETQVNRCKMLTACPDGESKVFKVDVFLDGTFGEAKQIATIEDSSVAKFWNFLKEPREEGVRVRSFFVKNMTKEVLQMFGTKYEVEPFFFSSSTNWIPSRYRENVMPNKSDHITVVLPFIRVIDWTGPIPSNQRPKESMSSSTSEEDDQIIDTQSPLHLRQHSHQGNKCILQDLLSVHMSRAVRTSTIISYHPKQRPGTAERLHSLINRTGRSVYWSKNFQRSKDPTCLFLCFFWYAMYEWDEVFETLYAHINHLEQLILDSQNIRETQYLHILQAHMLYYRTLLDDFRKSVEFVKETANPAMENSFYSDKDREEAKGILEKETDFLLSEIERLESQRSMQVMRLKNVIDLAFATVNIDDSKYMKELTVATVRDSAAMKQISYLTMVFLPANFMSNVFSMNVVEINPQGGETLTHYIISAVCLTVFAAWVAIALQVESTFFPPGSPMWRRAGWPVFYPWEMWVAMYRKHFVEKRKKA